MASDQGGDIILLSGGLGVDGGGLLVLQGRSNVTSIRDVDGHHGRLPNLLGRVVVHRWLQAFLQRREEKEDEHQRKHNGREKWGKNYTDVCLNPVVEVCGSPDQFLSLHPPGQRDSRPETGRPQTQPRRGRLSAPHPP